MGWWYNDGVDVIDNCQISADDCRRARFPLGVLIGVYVLSFALPMPGGDGRILRLPTVCPFNHATGLPCPGCGLTRAFVSIAHGHLVDAVRWHALSPVLFFLGLVYLVDYAARVFAGKSLLRIGPLWNSRAGWAASVVFLGYGVARAVYYGAHHIRF